MSANRSSKYSSLRNSSKIEIRNAAVLPVPVWDCTVTSMPSREYSKVRSWTFVHSTNPASRIPSWILGSRLRSVNFIGLSDYSMSRSKAPAGSGAAVTARPTTT